MVNCLLYRNLASRSGGGLGGGGFLNRKTSAELVNCTLSNNHSNFFGGGISEANPGDVVGTYRNTITWGNTASSGSVEEDNFYVPGGSQPPVVEYCCIEDDSPAPPTPFGDENENIDEDPLFLNPAADNYRFRVSPTASPVKDAGHPDDAATIPIDDQDVDEDGDDDEEPTPDLDRGERVLDGRADMGAYGDRLRDRPRW